MSCFSLLKLKERRFFPHQKVKNVIWKEVRFKNRHETLRKGECSFCNLETEIPKETSNTARPEKKDFLKSSETSRKKKS